MARGRFTTATKQAASVIKELQGNALKSVGTVRNYEQALKTCCAFLKEHRLGGLRELTPQLARQYLEVRATECSQRTLNMDRQAIQSMMRYVTHQLHPTETLIKAMGFEKVSDLKSEKETIEASRSYTPEQVDRIIQCLTDKYHLPTQICHTAGLRAHELLTLRPINELTPTPNEKTHNDKFSHIPNQTVSYSVKGKGGLIREVQIPAYLATKLEATRLTQPQSITDRGIHYQSHYNIGAGLQFSDAFSKASVRALGYTHGAHGLRHSYAQDRYEQLANHLPIKDVMIIVSQELGHFRPDITEVYLR